MRYMKKYYLILIFVCVVFSVFAGDVAKKNKEISSLLKSTNENDMAVGANQIIDGNRQNPLFVPLLINVLKTAKSSGAKCNAILALGVNRQYASSAVPIIISCLKDKDYRVVYNAIDVLGILAYSPQKVVPALLELNMDSEIKWHIFRALRRFGPSASKAIPFLNENVDHSDTIYAGEARAALYRIAGKKIKTDIISKCIYSIEMSMVEVLPEKIEHIYIKQNKGNFSIKISLNHLNFSDVNSFFLYLKQNIEKIKNKNYIIIKNLDIVDDTIVPVIKLLIKNKIDVYGKDAISGGYFKYISIRTDGLDGTSKIRADDAVEWNREVLSEADIQQITKINHKDYDTIIKLIKMGCTHKAQELKVKLLKDIDSEKKLSKNIKGKKDFDNFFRNIFIKREYFNQKIKNHELMFLGNMYRQNKHYVEAVLDIPNNKKENRKILINEIGKISKYSKDNKNCIYFPLSGDNKKDRSKIILACIIKKIFKENNIKSEIIFTKGKNIKQVTVVMSGFKKEIKYSDKEKMTVTIEKIMFIYYKAEKKEKQ